MSVGDWRVGVHPGDGAVARFGDCVLVVLSEGDAQREAVTELLALARQSAAGGGGDLVRRLAGFLSDRPPAELPSLGAIASVDDGVAVLVRGDVEVQLKRGAEQQVLSGREAVTWVDRIVEADFDEAVVEAVGAGGAPHPHADLGEGTVPGGGATLWPAGGTIEPPTDVRPAEPEPEVPVPTEGPPPEPTPSDTFVPILLDTDPEDDREPLPVAGEAPGAEEEGPVVQGVLCSRNHFNDPNSLYCATCGISMVHQTHNLVDGPRPPLGVMVVDDGSSYVLDYDYVVGRDPEQADEVAHGHSRAIVLPDVKKAISRVHARVRLDGWNVTVADAGSANGTFVAQPGDQTWSAVSDSPVAITPGTTVRVGHRTMMFDSHRRKS